jgi:hypothetical protein
MNPNGKTTGAVRPPKSRKYNLGGKLEQNTSSGDVLFALYGLS